MMEVAHMCPTVCHEVKGGLLKERKRLEDKCSERQKVCDIFLDHRRYEKGDWESWKQGEVNGERVFGKRTVSGGTADARWLTLLSKVWVSCPWGAWTCLWLLTPPEVRCGPVEDDSQKRFESG